METSDFLTILGLLLAAWAFIDSRERRFILLFFSKFEIGLIILSLIFIHYLMSFEWLRQNWWSELSIFTTPKGLSGNTWAYIVSLITIAYPICKVTWGYFSRSRRVGLISLYQTLLKNDELDLLVRYIEKYHIADIEHFVKGLSHLPEKEAMDLILRNKTATDKEYNKLIRPTRILLASWVYGQILTNETFVRNAAAKYPELFTKAFGAMETSRASNETIVKLYIRCLFETKNQSLIQELKIASDSYDSIQSRNANIDLPILSALFVHTEVAVDNSVWYPVGEDVVKSLKYDDVQREFLLKEYDDDLDEEMWNHKIYIGIVYFNYMVRETIYRESGYHMWLFYFRHFTDGLIKLIPSDNQYKDNGYPSFAHYMIQQQVDIMIDWLELAEGQNTDRRVIDTIRCLGWCLNSICIADNSKIKDKFKIRQLDNVLSVYFRLSRSAQNTGATLAREYLEMLFLNPRMVDNGEAERPAEYRRILAAAWSDFDRVPYEGFEENGSVARFRANVLTVLNIT